MAGLAGLTVFDVPGSFARPELGVSASGERVGTPPPTVERAAGADVSTPGPDEMASPEPLTDLEEDEATGDGGTAAYVGRRRGTQLELTWTSAVATSLWRAGRSRGITEAAIRATTATPRKRPAPRWPPTWESEM